MFLVEDNILEMSKFKAFADNLFKVGQRIKLSFYGIKNIVGKREIAVYQVFLLFSHDVFESIRINDCKKGKWQYGKELNRLLK